MSFITLTSDMGLKDHYVASLKCFILRQSPDTHIIDVSHSIPCFDVAQAAYTLRNVHREFPDGSVHIIGVRPEASKDVDHVIVRHRGHYYLSADNGVFHLLLDGEPEEVFRIEMRQDTDFVGFPTRDVLAKAAVHLAKGGTPEIIGRATELKKRSIQLRPILSSSAIKGHVMHVDRYENVITNIDQSIIQEVGRGRPFQMELGMKERITRISKTYQDVAQGSIAAVFTGQGYLEIGISSGMQQESGGASSMFGLQVNDIVRMEFVS